MKIISYCNKIIEYSFYALFFLVPLVFYGSTSELFELNKMWLTWGITVIIAAAWFTKMIVQKQFSIQRTPLDIPILLFLASQFISTLISMDQRISFWGYYSRFNGGLLSTISYILLYYAFVTNLNIQPVVKRLLFVTLLSGFVVILWGLPSHFGKDPTCLMFRGKLDVSCWTDAFRPTERMFSTLGQPAWLAAYLAVLIPVGMAYGLSLIANGLWQKAIRYKLYAISYILLAGLFYLCLLYTTTRAGFIGFWIANIVFWGYIFLKKIFNLKTFIILCFLLNAQFLLLNFFNSTPIPQLNNFSYQSLTKQEKPTTETKNQPNNVTTQQTQTAPTSQAFVTDSANIRLHVWKGAIDAWKASPLFGSGVETFAFAYYKHRPAEHNLTSEWDYLYNKAHNEYLNYLTTTGILGLGSYLLFIGLFIFLVCAPLLHGSIASLLKLNNGTMKQWSNDSSIILLTAALFAGWLSILITNFFGFSVVMVNLFLFLIPILVFILNEALNPRKLLTFPTQPDTQTTRKLDNHITASQWVALGAIIAVSLYFLIMLYRFWVADQAYALGNNLSHAGSLQEAYTSLTEAVSLRPAEPVFKDELSVTSSQIALALFAQQSTTEASSAAMANASSFAQQAIQLNNEVLTEHPNSLIYWKSRIRIFYSLAQIDERYMQYALQAAQTAHELAPTDAKIMYNLGVLYGQTGQIDKAISLLRQTTQTKPDYTDAYYALGLFYHDASVDETGRVIKPEMDENARKVMQYILDNLDPENQNVKQALESWGEK